MCGIVCIFNKTEGCSPASEMEVMLTAIAHRGNDQVLVKTHGKATVGFRRLSITALDEDQPGHWRGWIVYLNGEIYNYQELGYVGNECDVLVQGFREHGPEFVKRLNGMFFILAIHGEEVYAFRDRYGIKSVYVWENDNVVIVSSECKAINVYPEYKMGANENVARQWLTFNNVFTNETLFEDIHKIPPGHYIRLNEPSNLIQYWKWQINPNEDMDYDSAVFKVRELVIKAIEKMVPKEVSWGSCLSGGVDSSIISIISRSPHTFTVGYDGTEDERKDAKLSKGFFHHEIVYSEVKHFNETIYHLEDLRVGASWANYGLYKEASRYVKVILDGVGADELFGGYEWRYSAPDYWDIVNRTGIESEYCRKLYETIDPHNLKDRFEFDMRYFLEGVLLAVDKVSMAHTVEVRVPFLDNDLVDFCLTLPDKFRRNKMVLKDAFKGIIPDEIITAKKRGFTSPDWIDGEGNQANKWATAAINKWNEHYLDRKGR